MNVKVEKKAKERAIKSRRRQIHEKRVAMSEWHTKVVAELAAIEQEDPEEAVVQAGCLLDACSKMLLKLIESQKVYVPESEFDFAEARLVSHLHVLIPEFSRLVHRGYFGTVSTAWNGACELSEAIHNLALNPSLSDTGMLSLMDVARESVYMPSLRSNVNKFDYDFKKISKKIGLSRGSPVNAGASAQYSLDSLVTQFVVSFIQRVSHNQRIVKRTEELIMQRTGKWSRDQHKPSPAALRKVLKQEYTDAEVTALMESRAIPKLNFKTASQFWDNTLKPHVDNPVTIERLRGGLLYKELEKATDGKDFQMRDLLRKRCEQTLKSRSLLSGI